SRFAHHFVSQSHTSGLSILSQQNWQRIFEILTNNVLLHLLPKATLTVLRESGRAMQISHLDQGSCLARSINSLHPRLRPHPQHLRIAFNGSNLIWPMRMTLLNRGHSRRRTASLLDARENQAAILLQHMDPSMSRTSLQS